jgi:hypothetical protein
MTHAARAHAADILRNGGVANPLRLPSLVREAIARLRLDLKGLVVLTEAASGPFVVTPVIASLAGAERVVALTRNSSYASARLVVRQTRALEALCNTGNTVEIRTKRTRDLFAQADVVTNLGFVRPIDAEAIGMMKQRCVVLLMCEAWEGRPGDVDLTECRRRGIRVVATNEDPDGADVFPYVGLLALKLLLDSQIEVYRNKILIVSSDGFGPVVRQRLSQAGADVELVSSLPLPASLVGTSAVVVADYTRTDMIIGPAGDVTASELAQAVPGITVVPLAGWVDVPDLMSYGVAVYPVVKAGPRRMARTLAELGPRPVVELHAAGLKAGEIAARGGDGALVQWVVQE